MKSTTASALVALSLLKAAQAAPVDQPNRRQISIPTLSLPFTLPTGIFPTIPIGTGFPSFSIPTSLPTSFPEVGDSESAEDELDRRQLSIPTLSLPFTLPTGIFPTIPIGTGLPSLSIPSLSIPSLSLPSLSIPTDLPTSFPKARDTESTEDELDGRQLSIPTLSLPFTLPTGFPTIPIETGLPSISIPSLSIPTSLPTSFPKARDTESTEDELDRRQLSLPSISLPFTLPFTLPTGIFPTIPIGTGLPSISIPSLSLPTGLGLSEESTVTSASAATSTPASNASTVASENPEELASTLGELSNVDLTIGASDTENDVVDNAGCTSMTVIFARGTSESGNVGSIAGPPMLEAIESALGTTITKQGVTYDASILGNVGLGSDGGPVMSALVANATSQCPDSKIIISGYSQGAMVVHNAAGQSDFDATNVVGAILFGDPFNGESVSGVSNIKEFCADGDELCSGGGIVITPAHLTYGDDASDAATFAISAAGLS